MVSKLQVGYDAENLEVISDSIVGLGEIGFATQVGEGLVDIASYYNADEFDGSITIGFRSVGTVEDLAVELKGVEISSIDGQLSQVSDLASITLKALPSVYGLAQNYPNPFNPTTTIEYSIPQSGNVNLTIWNMAGQKVRTLVNESQAPSYYKIVWDGKNDMGQSVGTGMYFYKLVSGSYSKIQKMQLIK